MKCKCEYPEPENKVIDFGDRAADIVQVKCRKCRRIIAYRKKEACTKGRKFIIEIRADDWLDRHSICLGKSEI